MYKPGYFLKIPKQWDAGKKGKGGPRVEKEASVARFFLGAPGGIPIPFFPVAGTRCLGIFKLWAYNL